MNKYNQQMFSHSGNMYIPELVSISKQETSRDTKITSVTFDFYVYGESGSGRGLSIPGGYNKSDKSSVSSSTTKVDCTTTFDYTVTDINSTVETCVKSGSMKNAVFTYDDENYAKGMYRCRVNRTLNIDYSNNWEISINGFSVSAFSFFGDTSAFNEYRQDKLGMQNTGIEVYTKDTGNNREMVDVVIQATLADETNFILNLGEYSLFAFFDSFDSYAEDLARSWFQFLPSLPEDTQGQGTYNEFSKHELWDLPVLYQFSNSPTGSTSIVIKEHFGHEKDLLNGGTKLNDGIVIEHNRGAAVNAGIKGTVTNVGYNIIYGNYVEITADMNSTFNGNTIVSTVNGQRYQITGMKVIYGHLLSKEYGGYVPSSGLPVDKTQLIGNIGTSGRSSGNSLYMAIYIQADVLDDNDVAEYNTGWLAVDPEPYFTSKFVSGTKYTVYYD